MVIPYHIYKKKFQNYSGAINGDYLLSFMRSGINDGKKKLESNGIYNLNFAKGAQAKTSLPAKLPAVPMTDQDRRPDPQTFSRPLNIDHRNISIWIDTMKY